MDYARLTAAALVVLGLGGCAGGASNCAGWSAITLARSDKLTRQTEDQILAHNRQGEKQGCWSAPR